MCPYIKNEERTKFQYLLAEFGKVEVKTVGELNFLLTSIIWMFVKRVGINYTNINNIIGCLECVKQEFYRRVGIPYEEKKKLENGDSYIT